MPERSCPGSPEQPQPSQHMSAKSACSQASVNTFGAGRSPGDAAALALWKGGAGVWDSSQRLYSGKARTCSGTVAAPRKGGLLTMSFSGDANNQNKIFC